MELVATALGCGDSTWRCKLSWTVADV